MVNAPCNSSLCFFAIAAAFQTNIVCCETRPQLVIKFHLLFGKKVEIIHATTRLACAKTPDLAFLEELPLC